MSQFDWSKFAVGGAMRPDSFTGLEPGFASGVHAMTTAAHAAGIPLQITSAYRSPEGQAKLYEEALAKYGSPEAARKWVAPPGKSQHNHGRAVDFAVDGSLLRDPESDAAKWIKANAAQYGLHVPMEWEPWQVEMQGSRPGTANLSMPSSIPKIGQTPPFIPGGTDPRDYPEGILAQPKTWQDAASDAGGILAGALEAPVAPQIAPMQATPIQAAQRGNPYLDFFKTLV